LLEQPVIAAAKNFGEDVGDHECHTVLPIHVDPQGSAILFQSR
jgi:hypothetical protein